MFFKLLLQYVLFTYVTSVRFKLRTVQIIIIYWPKFWKQPAWRRVPNISTKLRALTCGVKCANDLWLQHFNIQLIYWSKGRFHKFQVCVIFELCAACSVRPTSDACAAILSGSDSALGGGGGEWHFIGLPNGIRGPERKILHFRLSRMD
jgi:hypothetical protein